MKSQILILILLCSVTFYSCESENDLSSTSDITTLEVKSTTISDEVTTQTENFISVTLDSLNMHSGVFSSDTVLTYEVASKNLISTLRDTLSYPKIARFPNTLVIDFGTGYTGSIYSLKGKLIVYLKDTLSLPAGSKKIIYQDFYVDNNKIKGAKQIIYKGSFAKVNSPNSDSVYYTIASHDTIQFAGNKIVWNSYFNQQKIKLGGDTLKYQTSGYAGGIINKNQKYSIGISNSNPLIRYSQYPFIVQGMITLTSNDHTGTLDYGNGTNDFIGKFTDISGAVKTIEIK